MKNLYSSNEESRFLLRKVHDLKESENKILVEVSRDANKIEIKKAIEEIFKVKVEKVSTINSAREMEKIWKVFRQEA